jgi:type I restriction enzyme M protein
VPEVARWETLRNLAKTPEIGKLIDNALAVIEAENPKLKGILDKRYARAQTQSHLPDGKLGELVDLVSTIGFGTDAAKARDVLGQVYEYFFELVASRPSGRTKPKNEQARGAMPRATVFNRPPPTKQAAHTCCI